MSFFLQLKQAISYTEEHLDNDGEYELQLLKPQNNVVQVKLQSRHTSSKVYKLWIEYSADDTTGWYCKCKAGARTVGCCAHNASVLWFLGYYRYQEKNISRPSRSYGENIFNAFDEDSEDELEDLSDWNDDEGSDTDSE